MKSEREALIRIIAGVIGSQDAHQLIDADIHEPLPQIYARAVIAALRAEGFVIMGPVDEEAAQAWYD